MLEVHVVGTIGGRRTGRPFGLGKGTDMPSRPPNRHPLDAHLRSAGERRWSLELVGELAPLVDLLDSLALEPPTRDASVALRHRLDAFCEASSVLKADSLRLRDESTALRLGSARARAS
jgi:hypothetical protein